jgi:4-amino-4-deoxy-L-arabinose transferase-like glycosyltransferase
MSLNKLFKWSEIKRDLLFLVGLSFIVKLCLALFTEAINSDGVLYITAAQEFAAGNFKEGLLVYRMPFYPLLIAITHYIVHDWILAARGVSLLTSILTVIPLYLLTRDLFGMKAAFWGCIAFALSPLPNNLAVEVTKDSAYLFFFAWTTYFALLGIESKKLTYFFLAGVCSTFSFLCRVEGIVVFFCYLTFLIYVLLRNSEDRMALIKGILVYISFPFVFLSMGSFILEIKVKHYTGKMKHFNRISFLVSQIKDVINYRFLENYFSIYKKLEVFEKTYVRKRGGLNFAEVARHHMYAVYLIGLFESFMKAVFAPYIIPLGFGLKNSKSRNRAFLVFLLACYLLFLYCSFIKRDVLRERHLLAPAFLLYPWIGLGIARLMGLAKQRMWKRFLILIFVFVVGILAVYKSVDILWKQDDVVVRAGQWIGNTPALEGAAIITTDRRIPFYAGRGSDYVRYYGSDYLAMEKLAWAKGHDVLVIRTSKRGHNHGPQLNRFKQVKEFVGVKDIVNIYFSSRLQKGLEVKGNQ